MEDNYSHLACISEGMTVLKGSLATTNDLTISGKFCGDIASLGNIKVESGATVKGNVIAGSFEIFGSFSGNLVARGVVKLHKGSNIKGTIRCGQLSVEEGAIIYDSTNTITESEFESIANKSKAYQSLAPEVRKPKPAPVPQPK